MEGRVCSKNEELEKEKMEEKRSLAVWELKLPTNPQDPQADTRAQW